MEPVPRHRCLVYEGSPARHLPVLAAALSEMLGRGCRCLYLNSPEMVAGMQSELSAKGVDVAAQIRRGALVLTSERNYLRDGRFNAKAMLRGLEEALQRSLDDGYKGFWATGDMTWEFGPAQDFSELLEYEWQLEEFFETHPEIGGVCQYHADTLPREAMRHGLLTHQSIFINETLSLVNPHFLQPGLFKIQAEEQPEVISVLNSSLDRLLQLEFAI